MYIEKTIRNIRISIKTLYLTTLINIAFIIARVKIRIKTMRILAQQPDEATKRRKAAEIKEQCRTAQENIMHKVHLRHGLTIGLLDFMLAVHCQYDDPANLNITAEERANIPAQFQRAKDAVLMNARWLRMAGEEEITGFIEMLEPIQLDTFTTNAEWSDYLDKLIAHLQPQPNRPTPR